MTDPRRFLRRLRRGLAPAPAPAPAPDTRPEAQRAAGFPEIAGPSYQEVLSALETALGARLYLEIGSRTGASLQHRRCDFVAVDPEFAIAAPVFDHAAEMHFFRMTSDDFFAGGHLARMGRAPDLAFVDGMHLVEYALRDFMNAEKAMTPSGAICLHDVCPFNHAMCVRDTGPIAQGLPWTGDVWKVVAILARERPDLRIDLLDARKTGLAVIRDLDPGNTVLETRMEALMAEFVPMTLADWGVERHYERLAPAAEFLAGLRAAA